MTGLGGLTNPTATADTKSDRRVTTDRRQDPRGGGHRPGRQMRQVELMVTRHVVPRADRAHDTAAQSPLADHAAHGQVGNDRAPERQSAECDERVAVIRRRIREGVYETHDMIEQVARRLLESGAL
jgi:hypothetical protein